MLRQTLRQMIYEVKLMHKKNLSANKISELGHLRKGETSKKSGKICLLGSLQINQNNIKPEAASTKKSQIVEQKKRKVQTSKKQAQKFETVLKQEMRIRQIRRHRQSLKIDRIQHLQLGIFQKSLGIKYIQKPVYSIEGKVITNHRSIQPSKFQNTYKNQYGQPSPNFESLPQRLIPSQVLSLKQYKMIFLEEKMKLFRQKNQAVNKSVYPDFKLANFTLSQVSKDSRRSDNQNGCSTQLKSYQSVNQNTAKQFSPINRTTSVLGYPKKNNLKKIFEQQKQFQDKLEKQKKQALQIRKQVNKNYAKPFNPPENISAQSYIVYEITKKQSLYRKSIQLNNQKKRFLNSHKILVEQNSRSPVQIASLTKIMTFVVALEICQKYSKEPSKQLIKIGFFQQNITGTTADLIKGDIYTLEQLFYGLMLPSGNDASLAIAVWGGRTIIQSNLNTPMDMQNSQNKKKRTLYQKFIQEMNKKAEQLGMQKTHYSNSHGLMNLQNKSCAFDLALICEHALKNEKFREVVKTKSFQCFVQCQKETYSKNSSPTFTKRSSQSKIQIDQIQQMNDFCANQNQQQQMSSEDGKIKDNCNPQVEINSPQVKIDNVYTKKVLWSNTHLLVQKKSSIYKGIKTGITDAAGPCLSSQIQLNDRRFIIIVLNCRTTKQRFRDTQNLRKWTFQKQQISFPQ